MTRVPTLNNVLSLYAGCGGLDLGFQQAGYSIVWANERDPEAAGTYANLVGDIVVGDIGEVEIPTDPVDLIIGGPPCQGFSVGGSRDRNDPRNNEVWRFADIVCRLRPEAFLMENVPSLASTRDAKYRSLYRDVCRQYRANGYTVTAQILTASRVSDTPQMRGRLFLYGSLNGKRPTYRPRRGEPVTVRQALSELPRYGQPGNNTYTPAKIVPVKNPNLRPSPYSGHLFNGSGRIINVDRPSPTVVATGVGNRTHIVDQDNLDDPTVPNWVIQHHINLLAGYPNPTSVPDRLRRLTIEEIARLQGFPPSVQWVGDRTSIARQIGNAVPPPLAETVATTLSLLD